MGYRVSGILKLPDGAPANNAEIEFISRKNFSPLVQELKSNINCSATGAYDVTLEYGEYAVIVYPGGTYPAALGTIILAADTVAGQDLPTLLQQAGWQPATPEYITHINTWLAQANASADRANNEASRATTQADRAKSEADRAAQITGINTVMDAIALAAIPLPDVWVPLSDSLRMITGYGRNVLVGSDVVASMVNFSRSTTATYIGKDGQLKTATANEPRFEKEGLLIEGQSTNLIVRSQQFTWPDGNGPSPGVQSPNTDPQSSALIPTIDVSPGRRRPLVSGVLTVGKKYTISFRAKSNGGAISQLANQLTGAVYPAVSVDEWKTYSFTGVATSLSVDFQITGTSVSIAWIQVEESSFSSSYIPTAGAEVTRTGDVCSLQASGNWPNGDFVIAANLSYTKGLAENPILFVSGKDTPTTGFINTFLRDTNAPPDNRLAWYGATTSFLATSGALSTAVFRNRSGMMDIVYDGKILSMGAGVQNAAVPAVRIYLGSYGPFQFLNGHLCNLRIWHRALSDEQIKAIA